MTTNSLAIYENGNFDLMQRTAKALAASGYFTDAQDEAKAIVKIMAGSELGIAPFAAMSGIHIIQGKPTLGANLLASLIKNHPVYDFKVEALNDEVCVLSFHERGVDIGTSKFTIEDAKRAGTKNLGKFPRNMLFARAISNGAKWYAAGIFGGVPVYTPEDFGATVDEDGVILEGEILPPAVEPETTPGGNGQEDDAPELDEQQEHMLGVLGVDFLNNAIGLIDRYDNIHAAKGALKKLGYDSIAKEPKNRVRQFTELRAHAKRRDAEGAEVVDDHVFSAEDEAPEPEQA